MIRVYNLSLSLENKKILDNLNIDIKEKNIFALLGPNGSGKSTFLKILLGVIPNENYDIYISGTRISEYLDYKEKIGYMPQMAHFPSNLTVAQIIDFIESLNPSESINKIRLIEKLGIEKFISKKFSNLSEGMKQKVNLLQCFMLPKMIYILDEPTSSLDPDTSYFLKEFILEEYANGKTIIFTSHHLLEVESIAKEIAILSNGKVIMQNSPSEIVKMHKSKNLEEAIRKIWSLQN